MAVVIGLDTSCYTTSAAAADLDGHIIASCRELLPVPAGERGLRQSEAVFAHVKSLPRRIEEVASAIQGMKIAAVCASNRPRDDESSYMPVFQVGDAQGRALASMLGVPYFVSTHQRGHISAAKVDSGIDAGDLLAVHLSGGTTEMLALKGNDLSLLGGTLDLHAGQLVDRAGVAMGLPFPSGKYLEELAVRGEYHSLLPVSFAKDGMHCHLSGAESQVQRWISSGSMSPEDIAIEIYDFLARTISRMVIAGSQATGIRQVLLAGGVSSSALFRKMFRSRVKKKDPALRVYFGHPEYSGDNAAGIALIGVHQLLANAN